MAETPPIQNPYPPASAAASLTPGASAAPYTATPQPGLTGLPVNSAPPALNPPRLPTLVEGRVISSNPQAHEIRIQIAAGEVVVRSDTPLTPDTKVSLKLYGDKGWTLASIAVLRQGIVQAQQMEQALPPPPALKPGQTIMAMLLSALPSLQAEQLYEAHKKSLAPQDPRFAPPPEEAESAATPPPRVAGAGLIEKLLSTYFPASWVGRPGMPATPASAAPDSLESSLLQIARSQLQARAAPPDIAAAPAPGSENLLMLNSHEAAAAKGPRREAFPAAAPPKTMYQLNILKIFPPQAPPEEIKAALLKIQADSPGGAPPQSAEVEAVTAGGFPILKTADSHFAAQTPASIADGSTVIFTATPVSAGQAAAMAGIPFPQIGAAPHFDPLLNTAWPTLEEALRVIQQAAPSTARALQQSLPAPAAPLAPAALLFLAALRLNAVESWLGGPALDILKNAGKKDLAERLGSEFAKISSQSREVLADGWRSIAMPVLHDGQVGLMQFYVRRQQDHGLIDSDSAAKPVTRFILNLHFSKLGEMQLDGLVQKRNFNLVLRTEDALSLDIRQEIMKRFALGLAQVHMQGGVSFQARQQGWVTVGLPQQQGTLV